jgi:hypothetical protein
MYRLLLVPLCFVLALAACRSSEPPPPPVDNAQPGDVPLPTGGDAPDPEDIVSGVGTIRYLDLEGGFYGIEADDGERYNPANLEEAFQEDGLRVRFRGVLQEDVVTIQMWGRPLELLGIMRL